MTRLVGPNGERFTLVEGKRGGKSQGLGIDLLDALFFDPIEKITFAGIELLENQVEKAVDEFFNTLESNNERSE